jgi:hypothetical protein
VPPLHSNTKPRRFPMHSRLHLSVLAAFICLPLVAGAQQQCPTGTTPVSVTGSVTTLNVSETKQVGQICLTLTTAGGREVFDDCGALIGKVTSVDTNTGTSTLNHAAMFDEMESLRTVQDVAQTTGLLETDANGIPCAMSIHEHMTNLHWGTGIFARATLDVFADGIMSFCPDKNLNTYQLTGQGCVRRRHR